MPVVLHVTVRASDAEIVAGRLWALGTTGIEERTTGAGTVLVAAFPTTAALEEVAALLGPDHEVEVVEVPDPAALETWRQFAQPIDVGSRLRVVPAWREAVVGAGRVTIRIDPGPCFGAGGHPTTRTILGLLESLIAPGSAVLDAGTGSGILAVAAASLGAATVVAVDIDPDAVAATEGNAAANGVADRISASTTPIEAVDGSFDVVLANLSAATLVALAVPLAAAVAGTGVLVVSGMLAGQWRHVAPAFPTMVAGAVIEDDGWVTVPLRPRSPP